MVTIILSLVTFSQIASSSIPYGDKLSDTRMNYNPIIFQYGARIASTTAAEDTCQRLPISNVTANGDDGDHPPNAIDNNVNTHWSNLGVGSWIQIDLGAQKTICSVDIAWYNGNVRKNHLYYLFQMMEPLLQIYCQLKVVVQVHHLRVYLGLKYCSYIHKNHCQREYTEQSGIYNRNCR